MLMMKAFLVRDHLHRVQKLIIVRVRRKAEVMLMVIEFWNRVLVQNRNRGRQTQIALARMTMVMLVEKKKTLDRQRMGKFRFEI